MKIIKILVVCFAGVLLLAFLVGQHEKNSYTALVDPQVTEMELVTTNPGKSHFLYALKNPNDSTQPNDFLKHFQYYCDVYKPKVCVISVWRNKVDVPKVLPATDAQIDKQYLMYIRNLNTGHESLKNQINPGKWDEMVISEGRL